MKDAVISKLELDMPDEKGISKRQHYNKVVEDSHGEIIPRELEEEVQPEFWDEPIFNLFFEIFQRGQEFYQTIYYFQQVIGMEFDGEDLSILLILWNTANKYLSDKEKKKNTKKTPSKRPKGRHAPRSRR